MTYFLHTSVQFLHWCPLFQLSHNRTSSLFFSFTGVLARAWHCARWVSSPQLVSEISVQLGRVTGWGTAHVIPHKSSSVSRSPRDLRQVSHCGPEFTWPCYFFSCNLFTLQSSSNHHNTHQLLLLLCSLCHWSLTPFWTKPHLLRTDVHMFWDVQVPLVVQGCDMCKNTPGTLFQGL